MRGKDSLGSKRGAKHDEPNEAFRAFLNAIIESRIMNEHPFDLPTYGWTTGETLMRDRRVHVFDSMPDAGGLLSTMRAVATYLKEREDHRKRPPYLRVSHDTDSDYFEIGCKTGIFIWRFPHRSPREALEQTRPPDEIFKKLEELWEVEIIETSVLATGDYD